MKSHRFNSIPLVLARAAALAAFLIAGLMPAPAQPYEVDALGGWAQSATDTSSLSGALLSGGAAANGIKLNADLTDSGTWASWVTAGRARIQTSATNPLAAGGTLAIALGGHTISGTHFAFATGQGMFLLAGGTVGSTAHELAFGVDALRAAVVFDHVSLPASRIIVGENAAGIVTLQNSSTLAAQAAVIGGTAAGANGTLALDHSAARIGNLFFGGGTATVNLSGQSALHVTGSTAVSGSGNVFALDLQGRSEAVFDDDLTLSGRGKSIALDDSSLAVGGRLELCDGASITAAAITATTGTSTATGTAAGGAGGVSITARDIFISGVSGTGAGTGTGASTGAGTGASAGTGTGAGWTPALGGSGSLAWSASGTFGVTGGAGADLGGFSVNGGPAGSLVLSSGQTFSIGGKSVATDPATLKTGDARSKLTLDGGIDTAGRVFVQDAAEIGGLRGDIHVRAGGAFELSGEPGVNPGNDHYLQPVLEAGGALTIDSVAASGSRAASTIADGWRLTGSGAAVIGGAAAGRLDVTGFTDNIRTLLETGALTIGDGADGTLNILDGARVSTADGAPVVLGARAGVGGTLNINGVGGLDGAFRSRLEAGVVLNAGARTGDYNAGIVVGRSGSAAVEIGTGGEIHVRSTVLAQEAGSGAVVVIHDPWPSDDLQSFFAPMHAAWTVQGSGAANNDIAAFAPSLGDSALTVNAGLILIKDGGAFSMGSRDYAGGHGVARFTGGQSELRIANGAFRNSNATRGVSGVGDIRFENGAIASGIGDIIAGRDITFSNAIISPGSRLMYDDHDTGALMGKLHLYAGSGTVTVAGDSLFRTALLDNGRSGNHDAGGDNSSHLDVHGDIVIGAGLTVDIFRLLKGDYLLVSTGTEGGILGDYTGHRWSFSGGTTSDSRFFTLNGKYITDGAGTHNRRITGEIRTYFDQAKTQLRLNIDAALGRNVVTRWTGATSGTWNMFAPNWDPAATDNTGQFLDGDIVIFDNPAGAGVTIAAPGFSGANNVVVAEMQVLGAGAHTFGGGSIIAYNSSLYSSATAGYHGGGDDPTGRLVKIGAGTLTLDNANEFYGGAHLGATGTAGGLVRLNNAAGFGHYNLSANRGYTKGMVFTHADSTIDATAVGGATLQNRFVIDAGATLALRHAGLGVANDLSAGAAYNAGRGGAFVISGTLAGDDGLLIGTLANGQVGNLGTQGAGVYLAGQGRFGIRGATIAGNLAIGTAPAGHTGGGGVYSAGPDTALAPGLTLRNNASWADGGGIFVAGRDGAPGASGTLTVNGDTRILANTSGGQGGGIFVDDAGRLVLDTTAGGILFEGNLAGVAYPLDRYSIVPRDPAAGSSSAIHLAGAAALDISGTNTVAFRDPLTAAGAAARIAIGTGSDSPAAVFYGGNSAVEGRTTVNAGATMLLAGGTTRHAGREIVDDASYGLSIAYATGTAAALTGTTVSIPGVYTAIADTFTLAAGGTLAGQGRIGARNGITLDGVLDLRNDGVRDTHYTGATTGSAGTLRLHGNAATGTTARWLVNLGTAADPARAGHLVSDRVIVAGAATFAGATLPDALRLDLGDMVHGKYLLMTTTGGITGFNTAKNKTGAAVYWETGAPGLNLASDGLTAAADPRLGRARAITYAGAGDLTLNLTARNRHVTGTRAAGVWQDNGAWVFNGLASQGGNLTRDWARLDTGPATDLFINGDMVTFDTAAAAFSQTYAINGTVRPVDLFVRAAATGTIRFTGAGGISTLATGTVDIDKTTLLPATDATGTNDYGIAKYTGRLTKTGAGALDFANGANTFTEGIVIGAAADGAAGGLIRLTNGNQLGVAGGAGRAIAFLGTGTLRYIGTANTTLAAPIVINAGKTAEFDLAGPGLLTAAGVISGTGALHKTGAGTLVLSGNNTFLGGATLAAGDLRLGHNAALSAYTAAGAAAGLVTVNGTGTLSTTAGRAIRNHFDVTAAAGTLTLAPAANTTLTIQNVNTGTFAPGAAIHAADGGRLLFNAPSAGLAFAGNTTATGAGGAIYAGAGALALTGRDLRFTANTAAAAGAAGAGAADALGGAVHAAAGGVALTGSSLVFTGNTATAAAGRAAGGAIFATGNITLAGGTIALTGNRASGQAAGAGGAIHADAGDVTLTGAAIALSGNTAQGSAGSGTGGAVLAKNLSLANTGPAAALLTSNTAAGASGRGGALFIAAGTLALNAAAGDIVFADNHAALGEAVYFAKAGATLAITGSRHVLFDDTICTAAAGNLLAKDGAGAVMFGGTGAIGSGGAGNRSVFTGTVRVNAGAFRVTRDTAFGDNTPATAFTLSSPAWLTGGGAIAARQVTLAGLVSADTLPGLFVESAAAHAPGSIGALTFDTTATGTLALAGAVIRVDLSNPGAYDPARAGAADRLVTNGVLATAAAGGTAGTFDLYDFTSGQYLLVGTGSALDAAMPGRFAVTVHGKGPTDRHILALALGDDARLAANATTNRDIWLLAGENNLHMYWAGNGSGLAVWNPYDTNSPANELWVNHNLGLAATAEGHVVNADTVYFGDRRYDYAAAAFSAAAVTTNTVAVTGSRGGVTVTAMRVDNGALDYTFTGGAITTTATFTGSLLLQAPASYATNTTAPQTLVKTGSAALVFRNTANTFAGGIRLGDAAGGAGSAGTLAFNHGAQLGDGGAGIHFRQDATLRADATASATNHLLIAAGKTATLSTPAAATALTLTGSITGAGHLAKTGPGAAILSGTSAHGGTTFVLGGTLALAAAGRLDDSAAVIDGGAATIDGGVWRSGAFAAGQTGTGALALAHGGTLVTTGTVYPGDAANKFRTHIGQETGSKGTVTLTGSSTWINSATGLGGGRDSRLTVGGKGGGALNVLDGSTVVTDRLVAGAGDGGNGAVRISGPGSRIDADAGGVKTAVTVGFSGSGRLVVENGAELNSNNASIGGFIYNEPPFLGVNRGHGEVLVTGTGSVWNLHNQLTIGDGADGAVTVAGGGRFNGNAATVYIGNIGWISGGSATSGTGALTVTGAGSEFATTGDIHVGSGNLYGQAQSGQYAGRGTLNIADGARVQATGAFTVADDQYAAGLVNFGTGGLSGTLATARVVGGAGDATFKFDHTDDVLFGTLLGGSLKVVKASTVAGASGTTTLTGGSDYTGGTRIDDGALVITGSAATAGAAGSTVALARTGTFVIGPQPGGSYALGNILTGSGALAAGSGGAFALGSSTAAALANGAAFTGEARMHDVRYAIDATTAAFFAGGAGLVTKPGSFGAVAGNTAAPGRAWDLRNSALVLNGGTLAWTIDGAHRAAGIIAAGAIRSDSAAAGTGTTTFQLNLAGDVDAVFVKPVYGNDASLFAMQGNTRAILLATGTADIAGAVSAADIDVRLYVGGVARSGSTITQPVVQNSGTTADAFFNLAALTNTGTDLSVGYRLAKLEVYENAELQVVRKHDDATGVFDTLITDKTTDGSVLFASGTGAARDITLRSQNLYTGTTTVGARTTLNLDADHALGNTGTHTRRLVVTASGALVNLGTTTQIAGSVDIDNTGGAHTGVLHLGASGTLAIAAAGGAVRGHDALTGTGALHLGAGTLAVTGSNAALAAAVDIAAGATAILNQTSGLGAATPGTVTVQGTGSIAAPAAANGLLRFDGAQGAFAKNLAGGGTVEVAGSGRVTLTGANTAFAGSYHAGDAATSGTLAVTGAATFGDARAVLIEAGSRLIADSTDDWTLGAGGGDGALAAIPADARGILAGAGVFEKTNTGTVTLARKNTAFSGDVEVNRGALRLTDVLATGTQAPGRLVTVSGTAVLNLDLAAPGAYLREITGAGGAGTVSVTGGEVTLGANNSAFTGTWAVMTSAAYADTAATDSKTRLGDGAIVNLAGTLALTATSGTYTFANALAGAGELRATLAGANDAFRFDTALAKSRNAAFTGTLNLRQGRFLLDAADAAINAATGKGAGALADATLKLGPGASTLLSDTCALGHLAFDGGTLKVAAAGAAPTMPGGFLTVTNLSGTGFLAVDIPTSIAPVPPSASAANVFEDDFNPLNAVQVVRAMGAVDHVSVALTRLDGGAPGNPVLITFAAPDAAGSAATGYYDYAATVVSGSAPGVDSKNGLYIAYGLTRINADEAGKLFVLDNTAAADNTLTAQLTGKAGPNPSDAAAGAEHNAGFEFRAAGTGSATRIIVGNAGSNYTGRTLVSRGLVELLTDHAFGLTSQLDLTGSATVDVAGRTQTAGLLNTGAGTTLDLHGGDLTLTGSNPHTGATTGTVAGTLTGAGALTLASGRLDILAANTAFTASTTIAAGARARLADTAGLGAARIALGGTLQVDNAAAGTMANTLEGGGHFLKTNTGDVTLTAAGGAFAGSGSIAAGRVIATRVDNLGAAPVGVAAPGVYELRGIAGGALQNTLSGAGALALTDSDLAIAHANTIENTTLANSQARLRDALALGGAAARVTLDARSTLRLETAAVQLGALSLNGGTVAFAPGNFTHTGTIAALDATPGAFLLNANLAAARDGINPAGAVANHLFIADAGAGAHTVFVNPDGAPAETNLSIELFTIGAGAPAFTLGNPGGKLEYGMTVLELLRGDGTGITPDLNKWYLTDAGLSHAADAILNTASPLGLDWSDSLHQRMGEVRMENLRATGVGSRGTGVGLRGTGVPPVDGAQRRHPSTSTSPLNSAAAAGGGGNLWVRARGYRLNASNAITGLGYRQYSFGMTGGLDKTFSLENGLNLAGGFVDMGNVSREFHNHGKGDARNISLGAYFTHLTPGGWFADLVGRVDRYKNSFEAHAVDGRVTAAHYTSNAQSVSLELGRRLQRADGWWVEPAVQAGVMWLNGVAYDTDRAPRLRPVHVDVGGARLAQYRARVRFGRQFRDSAWHPYGKFAVGADESDGGEVTVRGKRMTPDYDGRRVEFGFGVTYRIDALSQVYLDYEYAKSARFERPWGLTLGYRRLW
jgi:autotransporter-associated beta strand protein/T5SS/PEP-CTERM-associated repeat protein